MTFDKDFEITNAREWEADDDNYSDTPTSPSASARRESKPAPVGGRPSQIHRHAIASHHGLLVGHLDMDAKVNENAGSTQVLDSNSLPQPSQSRPVHVVSSAAAQQGSRSEQGSYAPFSTSHQSNFRPLPQRPSRGGSSASQRPPATKLAQSGGKPAKIAWARSLSLLTTRSKDESEEKEARTAEAQQYLKEPGLNEIFPSTAYYLWPSKIDAAPDLLGSTFEDLDDVKTSFNVWIDWDHDTHCIRIRSLWATAFDRNVADIIKRIRLSVENAKARALIAIPLKVVAPPTAAAWRAQVTPVLSQVGSDHTQPVIIGLKLSGGRIVRSEVENWKTKRSKLLQANAASLQEHMIKHLSALSPLKCWMRMRVNFGHVRFKQYKKDFLEGKYDYERFEAMVKHNRTTCEFDKKIEAAVAIRAMAELAEDQNFQHVGAPMKPKHTEVVFVTTPTGQNLRIEADLDAVSGSKIGEFQIGTTRLYHDNQRNKRIEVTAIDIESHFDWNIEIITDDSVHRMPTALQTLVDSTISGTSVERYDNLGLKYPAVSPRVPYNVQVRNVVVRSVLQYILNGSGYVVEVSIYREWPSHDTSAEPKLSASITVGHPRWDTHMESIEHTDKERQWEEQLRAFFPPDFKRGNGFVDFLDRIRQIRGVLCAAQSSYEISEGRQV